MAALDDGDTGFIPADWSVSPSVNQNYHYSKADATPSVATWRLTGLTSGEWYRLGTAWGSQPYLSPQARYEVYDGDAPLSVLSLDQQASPSVFRMRAGPGPGWECSRQRAPNSRSVW